MDLLQQFQGVLGSLLLGGLFSFGFTILKAILNHRFFKLFWAFLQIIYCLGSSYVYYLFLCFFTYGIYNFFFTISLFVGMIMYIKFYYPGIRKLLLPLEKKIDVKLNKIKFKKLKSKLKLKRKSQVDK